MNLFNSLGSNYNFSYLTTSLFSFGKEQDSQNLKFLLEEKYGGEALLFYKGREALSMALKIMNLPEGSEIAINGFTCVAVFNAIRTAGYEPVCLDLSEDSGLNFTPDILEKVVKKNKKMNKFSSSKIKAVVIQNTLGYPCDIDGIQKICKKNNLILIEDLAHCVGAKYLNGKESGTIGDFVCLSFSQDKIIDAVTGGALVVRNKRFIKEEQIKNIKKISIKHQIKDRLYPALTYKIRFLYRLKIGKFYHGFIKKLGLLSNIMDYSFYGFYKLPDWNAMLANIQYKTLSQQLAHRREISMIYTKLLPQELLMFDRKKTAEEVNLSSNLRFPIFVDNRESLIKLLKRNGIYLSDIWYTDVAPECPNANMKAKTIVNLPTHIQTSVKDAQNLSLLINKWLSKAWPQK